MECYIAYFNFLILRKASKSLETWIECSHMAIWLCIQKFSNIADKFKIDKSILYIDDKTKIQIGNKKA